MSSVIEPEINGNRASVGQEHTNGYSGNSQEMLVSMENLRPEGTEDQSDTYTSGWALGMNFHVGCY